MFASRPSTVWPSFRRRDADSMGRSVTRSRMPLAHAARNATVGIHPALIQLIEAIARVAAEQLVTAFAGQNNLHLLGGQTWTRKYSDTLDGQLIGSSSCQTSCGRALKKSSIEMTTSW